MITTFCEYHLLDDDMARVLNEGDAVDELTYWEGNRKVLLKNPTITAIKKNAVTIETGDSVELQISVSDIEEWN